MSALDEYNERKAREVAAKVKRAEEWSKPSMGSDCGAPARLEVDYHNGVPVLETTTYGGIAGGRTQCESERTSMAEEAYKQADYHADVANKALAAATFFRANPAFEEFIRLIRTGAIQL